MPPKKEFIDPKYLEDGKVLNKLKELFLANQTKEALTPLLACLRDAVVFTPMESDTIKNGNDLYFPMFSTEEEIPKEAADGLTMLKMPVVSCINRALLRDDINGLALDAFTKPLFIVPELAQIILSMPSLMEKEWD